MDRDLFLRLLNTAIGPRTQRSFAALCDMTPQYLNRLLHSDTVTPTIDTLTKIATHALGGVTLAQMMDACGYDRSSLLPEKASGHFSWMGWKPTKMADIVNQVLCQINETWFGGSDNGCARALIFSCADQITDQISAALSRILETKKDTFTCEILTNPNDSMISVPDKDAAGYQLFPVILSWETPIVVAKHKFLLRALPSYKCTWAAVGFDLNGAHFRKAFPGETDPSFGDPSDPDCKSGMKDSVYTELSYLRTPVKSTEERLLREIFGKDGERVQVPAFEEGLGFYIPEKGPELRKKIAAFFDRHGIPEDAEGTAPYYLDYDGGGEYDGRGPFGLVARIMREETGFRFYFLDKGDFQDNRPCIMIPEDLIGTFRETDKPDANTIRGVLIPYAKELGAAKIGTVWNRYTVDLPKDPEIDITDTRLQEAKEDFADKD